MKLSEIKIEPHSDPAVEQLAKAIRAALKDPDFAVLPYSRRPLVPSDGREIDGLPNWGVKIVATHLRAAGTLPITHPLGTPEKREALLAKVQRVADLLSDSPKIPFKLNSILLPYPYDIYVGWTDRA